MSANATDPLSKEERERLTWLRNSGEWDYDDQEFLVGLIDRLLASGWPSLPPEHKGTNT
jgi:hypothetical protein